MSEYINLEKYRNPDVVDENTKHIERYIYEVVLDMTVDNVYQKDELLRDLNEHMEYFIPERMSIVTTRLKKI